MVLKLDVGERVCTFYATIDDVYGLGGSHEIPLGDIFSNFLDDSMSCFLCNIFIVAASS